MNFYLKYISTPIGRLYAIADEEGLLSLDFEDSKYTEKNINSFKNCIYESNSILDLAEKELNLNIGKSVYLGFKAMSVATLKL